MALVEKLENIADAIRSQTGITEKLSLEEMVDAIYGMNGDYNLPEYWTSYLETKASEIKAKVDSASDTTAIFGYFTDAHVLFRDSSYNQVEGNSGHTGEIMRYLTAKAGIRNWVFGGDALAYETSLDLCQSSFDKVAKWLKPIKHLIVKGNHDNNSATKTPLLTDAQYHSMFYDALVPNNENATYYYYDDASTKTRYMMIDTRETSINYSYQSGDSDEKAYIATEIQWIYDTLNSTPENYQVIALPHIMWWSGGNMSKGNLVLSEAGIDLCTLLNKYNNRASGTQWGQAYDFTNAKGKAVIVITGHTHIDYSHTYDNIIAVSTTADSYQYANARPDSREHTKGTINEQAIDIWFIDQTTNKAESIRIGCGVDRAFTIGSGQVCNITNNLTNATSSNSATTATNNYTATITATKGTFTRGSYSLLCNNYDITSNYCSINSAGTQLTINTKNYLAGDLVINALSAEAVTFTIASTLTNCTISNTATSIEQNESYTATITANSGYVLSSVTCTMGGSSVSVVDGIISISAVTGNIVINATAEAQASYTNVIRTSQNLTDSNIYNSIGYKNGYYINSGNGTDSANANDCITGLIKIADNDTIYIKGYTGSASASHTRLVVFDTNKNYVACWAPFLSGNNGFNVETLSSGYYKLTMKSGAYKNYKMAWLRFSFNQKDGSGLIITKNEPIA